MCGIPPRILLMLPSGVINDDDISLTLGNFPEIFSLSNTSPQALPILIPYQLYFRFGGRARQKKIFDPQLHKILWIDFAVFWHYDPSWGPLEIPQIWLKSDDKILRNGEKPTFRTSFFSDFLTQSRIWRHLPNLFTELSGPFYTDNKNWIQ